MSIKQLIHACLLFPLFLGWVPASFAEATHFDSARKSFLAAEAALVQGNFLLYETIKKRLAHYPLLPYLIFCRI